MDKNYGGRYLAVILGEIIKEAPEIAHLLWKDKDLHKRREYDVEEEWTFPNRRRADLSILSDQVLPIALLEVKDEDHKSDKNSAQLKDYVTYCKKNNIPFTYLTKHHLPERDREIATPYHLTYAGLGHSIDKIAKKSPIVTMLYEYLKEEGFMFNEIDDEALKLLIVKSTAFQHAHGHGRLNKNDRITVIAPQTFSAILKNAAVISDRFYEDKGLNLFAQRPTVDYGFISYLDRKKADKLMKEDGPFAINKENKIVVAGELWAGAQAKFKSTNKLRLKFGFTFKLEVANKDKTANKKTERKIYAELWKRETLGIKFAKITDKSSEDQIYKKLISLINELISENVKNLDMTRDEFGCLQELNKKLRV